MLKYVQVDSDGYVWLDGAIQQRLHKLGLNVGRGNEDWMLFRTKDAVTGGFKYELIYETTDHVLFDNYLKLLLDEGD